MNKLTPYSAEQVLARLGPQGQRELLAYMGHSEDMIEQIVLDHAESDEQIGNSTQDDAKELLSFFDKMSHSTLPAIEQMMHVCEKVALAEYAAEITIADDRLLENAKRAWDRTQQQQKPGRLLD